MESPPQDREQNILCRRLRGGSFFDIRLDEVLEVL